MNLAPVIIALQSCLHRVSRPSHRVTAVMTAVTFLAIRLQSAVRRSHQDRFTPCEAHTGGGQHRARSEARTHHAPIDAQCGAIRGGGKGAAYVGNQARNLVRRGESLEQGGRTDDLEELLLELRERTTAA